MPLLNCEPCACTKCGAILNPYSRVNFQEKLWVCPFCLECSYLPPRLVNAADDNIPQELQACWSTVEYLLPTQSTPPAFFYVVDICMPAEELQALKESILLSITQLPSDSYVGLITFGTVVQVYDLTSTDITKSHVFSGTKDLTVEQVAEMLRLDPRGGSPLLCQVQQCDVALQTILDELVPDPWPLQEGCRALRSTGAALSTAVSILECLMPNLGARIMLFINGPCTQGPGMVLGSNLQETMRAHVNIETNTQLKHFSRAQKYYQALARRAAGKGHCIDAFMCARDQIGFLEMRDLVECTGGLTVLTDSFTQEVFKLSFSKMFDSTQRELDMAFNGILTVQTGKEFKVAGALGHCVSLERKSPSVCDYEVGIGGTCAWKMCGLNSTTTVALFYEITNQHGVEVPQGSFPVVQLRTEYTHPSGRRILRVTTHAYQWADPAKDLVDTGASFDQETAACLVARLAVHKTATEELVDTLRWIDRTLIRLVTKFATYTKGDASTFALSRNFSLFPQFMFYLRRSRFLRLFNHTPDETAYFRTVLNRETVLNMLTMIQPSLLTYQFGQPPTPSLLDYSSINPEHILLLDNYFRLVVMHGTTVAFWRSQGYQNEPSHAHFKALLEAPNKDIQDIVQERFPVPSVLICDQNSSQARFVVSQLNPSLAQQSRVDTSGGAPGENYFSDDVTLKKFMDYLMTLAVQGQ
ncbi:putative Protein transport protein Sec23A [Paratrimastix pyriformis]|uniref:Protein transport protein SEC23 n=1 Tax=Paratrimastix pyriformis TaxID=342808 RepID=A0ABQ8UF08_9EUKA|nr:putative Protein transport protein Sec23A [Paratrimastix pyriformis]